MKKKNYKSYLSYLRILATIAVIALHTATTVLDNKDIFDIKNNELLLKTITILLKWCVPVFIMITGALLLDKNKKYTLKESFKSVRKTITVLALFGIPYSILILKYNGYNFGIKLLLMSLKLLITGNSFAHLWYLYMLIGLYLVIPFIKSAIDNLSEEEIKKYIIIMFIYNFIFVKLSLILKINIAFTLPFTYVLMYLLLGYYLENKKTILNNTSYLILIINIPLAIILSKSYSENIMNLYAYDSPLVALVAISLFSLFKNKIKNNDNKIIWSLDRLCFGVYLIHPLFIQFVYRYLKITPLNYSPTKLSFIAFTILFTLVSFTGSFIMSKIKYLNKII